MAAGFPVVLNLNAKRCLVIGEGREADTKAEALAQCGALVERIPSYQPGALHGFFLAVAASMDRTRNAEIFAEAASEGVMVNCLDDPKYCHFTFPSVYRQGDLLLTVSTDGACPALSVRIRESFEQSYGPEYAEFLGWMSSIRDAMKAKYPEFAQRRDLWYALVDSEILPLLRAGDRDAALRLLQQMTGFGIPASGDEDAIP